MKISSKKFNELSLSELYQILQLRSEVFVLEQNCIYQDIDGKDEKADHILIEKKGKIIAYGRCFGPGIYFSEAAIGRVLVKKEERKQGLAHRILQSAIEILEKEFQARTIKLSAQQYLIGFYESHGFKTLGNGYLEDGIPHITMVRMSKSS